MPRIPRTTQSNASVRPDEEATGSAPSPAPQAQSGSTKVAETQTDYFIKVSREFDPLDPIDSPCEKLLSGAKLDCYVVASQLRKMLKPKLMVPGDISSKLVTLYANFFAILLTNIYSEILTSYIWPTCWKREFVTIISKKSNPELPGDCRNISCTMLASKVFESFVLDMLKLQVKTCPN